MNSTSRASRLVSSAARSPALAITGPEVARKFTPSSRATIWASVGLPRPGGRTDEQHWGERLAAGGGGLDEDAEIGARLALADELVEPLRAQRGFRRIVIVPLGSNEAAGIGAHDRRIPCSTIPNNARGACVS